MCLRKFLWYFLYLCWDEPPYGEFTYSNRLDALRGVSDLLHKPLARLTDEGSGLCP